MKGPAKLINKEISWHTLSPNHFIPQSFCLSVPSSVFRMPLLKTKSHKPPKSCHKVILTLTNLHKAIQTSKKNRQTNLVHKPSPRSAAVTGAGTSGVPPRRHQIQNEFAIPRSGSMNNRMPPFHRPSRRAFLQMSAVAAAS